MVEGSDADGRWNASSTDIDEIGTCQRLIIGVRGSMFIDVVIYFNPTSTMQVSTDTIKQARRTNLTR